MRSANTLEKYLRARLDYDVIIEKMSYSDLSRSLVSLRKKQLDLIKDFLIFLTYHENKQYRSLAAREMGYYKDPNLNSHLLKLISDRSNKIRLYALRSAGKTGDPSFLQVYSRNFSEHLGKQVNVVARCSELKAYETLAISAREYEPLAYKVAIDGISGSNARVAVQANHLLKVLRSSDINTYTNSTLALVERYRPVLSGNSNPIGMINGKKKARVAAGKKARIHEDPIANYIKKIPFDAEIIETEENLQKFEAGNEIVLNRFSKEKKEHPPTRFLYGGITNVIEDGKLININQNIQNHILFTNEKYRYSICISQPDDTVTELDKYEPLFGEKPVDFPETQSAMEFKVVLLINKYCLQFIGQNAEENPEDNCYLCGQVKTLVLPEGSKSSTRIFFDLQASRSTDNMIFEVLVYYQGCLISRSRSRPYIINDPIPGMTSKQVNISFDDVTLGSIFSFSESPETTVKKISKDTYINLLIDECNDKYMYVLLYPYQKEYKLEVAMVEKSAIEWNAESIDQTSKDWFKVNSKILMKLTFTQLYNKPFPNKFIEPLKFIGEKIYKTFFFHVPTIWKALSSSLINSEANVFQIVTDKYYIPWQLLYLEKKDANTETNKNVFRNFVGSYCQTEQVRNIGNGLPCEINLESKPMAIFYNNQLNPILIQEHIDFFGNELDRNPNQSFYNTKKELINELERTGMERIALYFYCHGYFGNGDSTKTAIALEKDQHITLEDLQTTKYSEDSSPIYFKSNPLIFINACESGKIGGSFYSSLPGFFLNDKQAGCYVSPEIIMPDQFAAGFAFEFFRQFKSQKKLVRQVLFDLRRQCLLRNNPLGLFYDLYSNTTYSFCIG